MENLKMSVFHTSVLVDFLANMPNKDFPTLDDLRKVGKLQTKLRFKIKPYLEEKEKIDVVLQGLRKKYKDLIIQNTPNEATPEEKKKIEDEINQSFQKEIENLNLNDQYKNLADNNKVEMIEIELANEEFSKLQELFDSKAKDAIISRELLLELDEIINKTDK